ncbi:Enoyl-CoA delta isomerase 1, mitochondrial [Smittium mucronatum]|uniref:Enoyl-CoA delta isomerase 1, mitochondrial n=1 Tax=Smittium mucronatum TaxID=133383 RepID=A0A1R0GPK4_9FUNG|nr:Enoyl-CoA delta isomerase 1, mitochondrial [Smittium mucronatum]
MWVTRSSGVYARLFRESSLGFAFGKANSNLKFGIRSIIDISYKGTTEEITSSSKDKERTIAIMSFNNPPANTFNMEHITEFKNAFGKLEKDPSIRGVILTSSLNNMFTAGVDLQTFSRDKQYLMEFWAQIAQLFRQIYSSRLLTLSAINGHCLALGVVFALASHDRFMLNGPYKIGLNEVQVGIPLPIWLIDVLKQTISGRMAEKFASDGSVIGVQEALKVGLVDHSFDSQKELLEQSLVYMRHRSNIPEYSQVQTMKNARKDFLDSFDSKVDIEEFVGQLMAKETQDRVRLAAELLSKKKSPKK